MKLSDIAVNADAIELGRWVPIGHILPGVRLKVRGLENTDYRRLRNKLIAEIPRAERLKGVDTLMLEKINAQLLADTILVGWEGIEGDDDLALPFTKEKASQIINDPSFVVFRNAVEWAAGVVGEDDLVESEAAAKN